MSGRSVTPILEKNGDVYITGSTVVRHKIFGGRECDVFPDAYDTQLVLSAKSLYKLRQRHPPPPPPPPPPAAAAAAAGNGEQHHKEEGGRVPAAAALPPPPELAWRESLGVIRAVVPLRDHPSRAWAAGLNEVFSNCHGFAIEYFSVHKEGPKPAAQQTVLQRYMKEVQCLCVGDVFTDVQLTTQGGGSGGLRVREFHVGLTRPPSNMPDATSDEGSLFLQQDWCHAFRVARMNYWHERLEDHLIEEPEIFQYQVFAMEFRDSSPAANPTSRNKAKPLLCQLALSTERLYVVPRYEAKLLSTELPLHHPEMLSRWMTVAALQSASINQHTGVVVCVGRQQQQKQKQHDKAARRGASHLDPLDGGATVTLRLGFFNVAEAEEAMLEIQRVWELTHRHEDFPLA
ncbi:hypothetical protein DQ04_00801060 [Trypanosoma grayi]|uniref:hypothetical protein n=1 Tax=Trypanosoma grayi TaxID=71804 RepID=UPI0004F422EB|nr:hypothetical protein DQ04_00801060 [Trypanosoma grayi]KEG13765.1 hypothetical protein DQ04_00801060 [Trypanosoma grayi]